MLIKEYLQKLAEEKDKGKFFNHNKRWYEDQLLHRLAGYCGLTDEQIDSMPTWQALVAYLFSEDK